MLNPMIAVDVTAVMRILKIYFQVGGWYLRCSLYWCHSKCEKNAMAMITTAMINDDARMEIVRGIYMMIVEVSTKRSGRRGERDWPGLYEGRSVDSRSSYIDKEGLWVGYASLSGCPILYGLEDRPWHPITTKLRLLLELVRHVSPLCQNSLWRRWWLSAGSQEWRNLRPNPKIVHQPHRFWAFSLSLMKSITTQQLFCSWNKRLCSILWFLIGMWLN